MGKLVWIGRIIVRPPGKSGAGHVVAEGVFRILVCEKNIPAVFAHFLAEFVDEIRESMGIAKDVDIIFHDPDRFIASHIDPNTEVGRRYNYNQEFTHPRVAIATKGDEIIGCMYTAHNVSGSSEQTRLLKRLSVVKNYLWVREVAVRPEYQIKGIAKRLGRASLEDAIGIQPVAAYIWPDEIDFLQGTLERYGFLPTGEQCVEVFGENSKPIKQIRMQAPTVRSVLRKL